MSYDYERVPTPATGLRLHLNENTQGCSPRVIDALRRLTRTDAAFYPDYDAVTSAVAAYLDVTRGELVLTNGLDEGILGATIAAGRDRTRGIPEAIVVVPAFDMYAACADVTGARVVEVQAGPDFDFPLAGVLRAITAQTRIVFLTSPNNPTGVPIEPDALFAIASAAPGALIFLDEAYADFAGTTVVGGPALKAHRNIVVGRTFAKAYGLAALRAGAVIGDPATLAPIRRAVPPYSLNACAAAALCAALEDVDYYRWYLDQVRTSRDLLYGALARLGVRYWRSGANFVLADFGHSASRVVEGLARREVLVRDRSKDPACRGCVRITAGVVEHTRACIAALEEVLCGAAQ